MKRLFLALVLVVPAGAQFAVWDSTNFGVNWNNFRQAQQSYQQFQTYQRMFQNASAFLHNPAAFLASAANVQNAAEVILQQGGASLSAARVAQLQKIMTMERVAMNEAQSIETLSHGNSAAVGQMAVQLSQTAEQLAEAQHRLESENRTAYYRARSVYHPQAEAISSWRLK